MSSKFVHSIQDNLRKVVAFTAAIMLAIGSIASPALAEELDEPVTEDPVSPFSTDPEDIIALTAGSISGGSGSLNCFMSTGNMYATIQAKTAPNASLNGAVDCYVEFPNGNSYYLGTIPANNGETTPANFFFCPYGEYKFIFDANITDAIEVQGFIFD